MNEIPTWEQFIRFVLQGLSNGTTMQIHEFKEHLTNIPCNKVISNDAQNVLAWAFLIYIWQLTQLIIKYSVGVETRKTLKIVRVDEDYFA